MPENIMALIARIIPAGTELKTPDNSRGAKFLVESIHDDKVIIRYGEYYKISIPVPAECFEAIVDFLRGKDWVKIGAIEEQPKQGTLEECTRPFTRSTMASCYIASIMREINLVDLDGKRPNKIRLRPSV